ncbi:MAG: alpha/beta fold hydrolase [Clostridium sp.]|nr:alpha/beta fold hydrolase [Clostridium sp.]
MKRAYADIAEGQMHYRCGGRGEPVVMLHMSGSSSDEFEKTGDLLSEKYRVYAPDLLAFGYSDKPPRTYTLEEHAGTVAAFMDVLGIQNAYLVGNLVGANIAVHVAMLSPGRVKGMFLSSFCYGADYREFQALGKLPVYQPIPEAEDGSHLVEMWKRTQRYQETTGVIAARTLCMHLAGQWSESLHAALFSDVDLTGLLAHLPIPVKLIGAPEEEEKLRLVAGIMQNGEYEIVHGLNPFFDRKYPEKFAKMIEQAAG